jgi:hypothetical protein
VGPKKEGHQTSADKPQFSRQDDGPVVPIIPTEQEAEPLGNEALRHGDVTTCDGEVRHHFTERDLWNKETIRSGNLSIRVGAHHHGECDSPNESITEQKTDRTWVEGNGGR